MEELRCPSCGADVSFRGEDLTVCPYCGSQLYFGGPVDKAELERLRYVNSEYERSEANAAAYKQLLKSWRKSAVLSFVASGIVMAAGFSLLAFEHTGAGAPLVLLAFAGLFFSPLLLGAFYPCFDENKGEMVSGSGKKVIKILLLYGCSISVFIVSIILGIAVAALLGADFGDDDEDEEDKDTRSHYSDDTDIFVNDWAKASYSDKDDDLLQYLADQCPGDIWEEDKDSEDTLMTVEYQRAHARALISEYDVRIKECEKHEELSDKELEYAETYFMDRFDSEVNVTRGYEYHILLNTKSKEDGEKEEYDDYCCVVKLKDDDWKIIPYTASELKRYSS